MSPYYTASFFASRTSYPTTGSPMFFLYFYFVILLCPVTTSPAPQTSSIPTNASEYILRNVFDTADQCYKDSFVYVKASDDEISSPFSTYVTTKECSERLNKEDLPDNLPTCSPGLIDLDVRQVYVPKSQISYPYANLNISVTAHSSVDTIAFRLECLSASDGSDVYCSDSKSMYINNKKEWPCRGIHLSTRVIYPARFSYACFRLTSHSVYAINATVLPQKCRVTTIVTAPSFDDMFPEILVDPSVNKKTVASADPFWAPLIAADFSDENAIWLRLAKAHRAECETINVNVYKEHVNDSQKVSFLETLSIKCPENSIKWENQVAGKYLLTAYVPIRGCKFFCEKKERGCRQCLRTHLNLVVHETRVSLAWRASQTLNDYGFEIFVSCMCIVGLTCLAVLIITLYLCWKRKKESERVREIPLTEYVKAMIVYADDNELHTDCVKILVDNLRNCANCDPIFDLEKLITPEQIVPSRWLVDQLGSLSKFIIVISDCAEKILDTDASETHQLVQSRPFADLFGPAIEIIIRDATRNSAEARQKYAIVRFSYSPQVPANLTILNLPTFTLPEQFGHLTAFLHDLKDVERMNITQNISEGRIHEWNVAAGKQMLFFSQNPDWLNARWKPKDELAVMNLKRESPVVLPIETVEDRIAASKRFHLEPPRDDSDDEETHASNDENTFMLLPPGQNDSDSESDVEDEDDDEGSKTIVAHSS